MSDEGDAANDAARDGGDTEESRDSGARTAVVTRPQRPTGKRSRQRVADADDVDVQSPDEAEVLLRRLSGGGRPAGPQAS